jgi:hypothetical protein
MIRFDILEHATRYAVISAILAQHHDSTVVD